MKSLSILAILGLLVFSFQNCGETVRSGDFLSQGENALASNDCGSDGCLQSGDFIWMSIREYEPYKIEISTTNIGHFNIGGQCGVGNFENHTFLWELREGFGSQRLVGQGFADNRCRSGKFIVPIIPNQAILLEPDQRYSLTMELVGLTSTNEEVSNPMPNNQGSLDIIFTTTPPN